MSELFNVVFRGDILPGHDLATVKAQMAQLFKLDDVRLAAVFSGKPVVLKKDCDIGTAEKIKAALTRVGADSEIKSNAPPVAVQPAVPLKPVGTIIPSTTTQSPVTTKPAVAIPAVNSGIKLAPMGPVLTEAERAAMRKAPIQVKTDHIGLEKRASSFGSADDKPAIAKRPEIKAPDFGVAATGGDLLREDEKRVYEELEIDLSDFHVAELGADMLREDEKIPLPVMEIEELNADLAPIGSDMAQIKKAPPPPPPKTDHLKLV